VEGRQTVTIPGVRIVMGGIRFVRMKIRATGWLAFIDNLEMDE